MLALGRKQKKEGKFSIKRVRESKKRKKNSQLKSGRKQKKKRKKIPNQGSEENRRNMQKGLWARQYLNKIKLSQGKQEKKGNHDLKWSSLFDWQPKSCASMTCSPHTKQKQKRKRPKTLKAKFPTKKTIPKKKSYWSMITHVIFDLIGNDLQNQVMTYLWFEIRMKHLPVWDWYTLSDFLLFLLDPVFPLNGHLETKC